MFTAVAQMFDGEKQWRVIISTHPTFAGAEKAAYDYLRHYDNNPRCSWLQVLWLQVLPADTVVPAT